MEVIKPIRSGSHSILASGSIISFGDDDIEFEVPLLKDEGKEIIPKVLFSFSTDENEKEPKMEFALQQETQTLEIKITNANYSLDGGNEQPIDIGTSEGRQIFLNFRIRKTGSSRTIMYTLYGNN